MTLEILMSFYNFIFSSTWPQCHDICRRFTYRIEVKISPSSLTIELAYQVNKIIKNKYWWAFTNAFSLTTIITFTKLSLWYLFLFHSKIPTITICALNTETFTIFMSFHIFSLILLKTIFRNISLSSSIKFNIFLSFHRVYKIYKWLLKHFEVSLYENSLNQYLFFPGKP